MTISAMILLGKLKRAQISPDRQAYIDFEKMDVVTVHEAVQPYKTVSLKKFSKSIFSALSYLAGLGYIDYNKYGSVKVTHLGWHAFRATVQGAVKFTFRDIVIPVVVTIITTIILRCI